MSKIDSFTDHANTGIIVLTLILFSPILICIGLPLYLIGRFANYLLKDGF